MRNWSDLRAIFSLLFRNFIITSTDSELSLDGHMSAMQTYKVIAFANLQALDKN
jgi:hypothetical protein